MVTLLNSFSLRRFSDWLALYAITFLASAVFNLSPVCVRAFYWIIHLVLLRRLWTGIKQKNWLADWRWSAFLVILFFAFYFPGAYLEFPADPWEHFRRIFRWNGVNQISDYENLETRLKTGYFLYWSWIGASSVAWHRPLLDLVSTITQFILAIKICSLARSLGSNRPWQAVHILAFFAFFGINLFSYRYYAISTSILALVAYLELIELWLKGSQTEILPWKKLLLQSVTPIIVISLNHTQELLFAAISVAAFLAWFACSRWSKKNIFIAVIFLVMSSALLGRFLVRHYPSLYANPGLHQISKFGSFRIWNPGLQFLDCLGVHGIFGLIVGLILIFGPKKGRLLGFFSIGPAFVLLFPISALIISLSFRPLSPFYRILFAFPLSTTIVYFFQRFDKPQWKTRLPSVLGVLIILYGFQFQFPWRGRLFFQFYIPPDALTLRPLDRLAQFVEKRPAQTEHCILYTDDMADYVISAHLGHKLNGSRFEPVWSKQVLLNWDNIWKFSNDPNACGILAALPGPDFLDPVSIIGKLSGHWNPETVRRHRLASVAAPVFLYFLKAPAWKIQTVEPHYFYFQAEKGALPIDYKVEF